MHHLALQLHDGHRGMLVSVEFDESKAAIGLHADLGQVADRLEEGDEIGLGAVRDEIADVDGGVVRRGLLYDGFV